MKPSFHTLGTTRSPRKDSGMTLAELMVAVAIGSLVLAVVAALSLFGLRTFAALGNYRELDAKSRAALDVIVRDVRQEFGVKAFLTNSSTKWLEFTNSSLVPLRYTWDSASQTLVTSTNGVVAATNLTGCSFWEFALFQRTPHGGATNTFYPATNSAGAIDVKLCKLVSMTWKCSRNVYGWRVNTNTESVQSAQIVMRNKQ